MTSGSEGRGLVPRRRASVVQVVHLTWIQQVLELPEHSALSGAGEKVRKRLNRGRKKQDKQTHKNTLRCSPFALFPSTFWVDKNQKRVGVWNSGDLRQKVILKSCKALTNSAGCAVKVKTVFTAASKDATCYHSIILLVYCRHASATFFTHHLKE